MSRITASRLTAAWVLALVWGVVAPATAGVVPFSGTVSYTTTHDSGFLDATGQPLRQVFTIALPAVELPEPLGGFRPPTSLLTAPNGAGSSFSQSGNRVVRNQPNVVAHQINVMTGVNQSNPLGAAVGAAKLRMDFSATFSLDGTAMIMPLPRGAYINGAVGAGEGAYIQFEAKSVLQALDASGNVLASLETLIGGDKPVDEADIFQGGGRITRKHVPDGKVPAFGVMNNGPMSKTPWGLAPAQLPVLPRLNIPSAATTLLFSGYVEVHAKNDGSPSGIFIGESIPEPAGIGFVAVAGLLLARRTRRVRPARVGG